MRICFQDAWNPALGPSFLVVNENVEGSKADSGWLKADFVDESWDLAVKSSMKAPMLPILEPRRLVPRSIPPFPEIQSRFTSAVKCDPVTADGAGSWNDLVCRDKPRIIPAGTKTTVVLDSAALTTGFLRLRMQGGAATKIRIRCAECFEEAPDTVSPNPFARKKNDRSDTSGVLVGPDDFYTVDPNGAGDVEVVYEPFWFRTFRYVEIEIETSTAPMTLLQVDYRTFHYPLATVTRFEAFPSQEESNIWRISLNTLQNCMHETYEDCPFYEQNQFAMDARLQILFTYQLSQDDRLARKCIQEFYASRRPDGLIETHFPSPFPGVNIPYFSLYWVLMIYDHMMYFGDESLVRRYLGTIDGILDHFHQRVNDEGLVGRLEYDVWPFVDWTREWSTATGGDFRNLAVPPAYRRSGVITYSSLIYAYVLNKAAGLCDFLRRSDTASEYRQRASKLNEAVMRHCFQEEFLVDGPDSLAEERSQHTQVFAVLSGALEGDIAKKVLRRAISDSSFVRCSYAMSFYVFEACHKTGLYDELRDSLFKPWRKMVDMNLTTWAESEAMPRSDCHGWSAVPIHDFVANVAGLTPAAPGFKTIRLDPRRQHWKTMSGNFAVGPGSVSLCWAPEAPVTLTPTFDTRVEVVSETGSRTVHEVAKNKSLVLDI